MEVEKPEQTGDKMIMFCLENRITRELFWSGFGFQIWCQLLTHISRSKGETILIIDEPEIYLHPDVQRQLLGILRTLGPSILIATHSTEIMAEADPSEIVVIDKTTRSGERLRDAADVQAALEQVGSLQNISLARLARSKRVLFVEGDDFRLLTKFARAAGFQELAAGTDIVPVAVEGFSGWERIRSIAWGINRTLGTSLVFAAVLDRDYHPEEEIQVVQTRLEEHAAMVHIHDRKELENYLLVPSVIERASKLVLRSSGKEEVKAPTAAQIEAILEEITTSLKSDVGGQLIARRSAYSRGSGIDSATAASQAMQEFDTKWKQLESRLAIVPGKEVLKRLRERLQEQYGLTLTTQRIVTAFRKSELPAGLMTLLQKLEEFRKIRGR